MKAIFHEAKGTRCANLILGTGLDLIKVMRDTLQLQEALETTNIDKRATYFQKINFQTLEKNLESGKLSDRQPT